MRLKTELICQRACAKAAEGGRVLIACLRENRAGIAKRISDLNFVPTMCESGVMVTAPGVSTELPKEPEARIWIDEAAKGNF